MRSFPAITLGLFPLAGLLALITPARPAPAVSAPGGANLQGTRLRTIQYVADSTAFDVNAVLIVGPTEALLIDGQYHLQDARRVADGIAATGKRLKAVFITHPDHDHYAGAAAIIERFPGTPVYLTAAGLAEFNSTARENFQREKSRAPERLPDSLVTPQQLPTTRLTVDGETVEIIPDLQGDVLAPTNSIVWIPSLKTVIAGDVVFNGVHPWFGASNATTRQAWHQSLQRITGLHPSVVIAGHKPTADASDAPGVVQAMDRYLTDFDAARASSADAKAMFETMHQKYGTWVVEGLLRFSVMTAFRQ